ncbi:uncharacterized protein LOC144452905 [Glandiceps talaboti]
MSRLENKLEEKDATIKKLQSEITERDLKIKKLQQDVTNNCKFGVDCVLRNQKKLKGLFKYYTGISYVRFLALLSFLLPNDTVLSYKKVRTDIKNLAGKDCLLLCLCRLRHNFGLRDLAVRFGLGLQSAGDVFNTWIDHMYWKLGQISIWPHRSIIMNKMPADFKRDFPRTVILIDCTELKTQQPSALALKRNISDVQISEQSGFLKLLKQLLDNGYLNPGDAIMSDKGFTIQKEISELGLQLNIPPFISSSSQMSVADTQITEKIAKHRIHIERLIAKIKTFKIVSDIIQATLFEKINSIWSVCCYLTLFQDVFVKEKTQ